MVYEEKGTKATYVAVHPDGQRLAVGCSDERIILWDMPSGAVEGIISAGGYPSRGVWLPDGSGLLATTLEGALRVYEGTQVAREVESGHEGDLRSLHIRPGGDQLVTGGGDGMLRVRDLASLEVVWENGLSGRSFDCAALCGDDVVVGMDDGRFVVYTGPGEDGALLNGTLFNRGVSAVAVRPQGDVVVLGGAAGGLHSISSDTEQMWPDLHRWPRTPPRPISVNELSFSPDGSRFLAACSDDCARLFRWGEEQDLVPTHLGQPFHHRSPNPGWHERFIVSGARFSPDGQLAYTCSFDGKVRRWVIGEGHDPYPDSDVVFSIRDV